jgi:hypothetical protein
LQLLAIAVTETNKSTNDTQTEEDLTTTVNEISEEELNPTFDQDLWLDRVARVLGFGRLSAVLPGQIPPSYLYAGVLIFIIDVVLNVRAYLTGEYVVYLENPFFVFQPLTLLCAAYGARALRSRYHQVMHEMDIPSRASNDTRLLNIVPYWLPWAFFAFLIGVNFIRVASYGGPIALYQNRGLSELIGWLVANPIWATIASQFLAVYLSIVVLSPWRIWRSDVGINFLDPEGLGGLRPIGELIKHAYYYQVAGLIAFALILYTPGLSIPDLERTAATNLFFTIAWIGAVATIAAGVFMLHRFMHQEKRHELLRLKKIKQKHIKNKWNIAEYTITDDKESLISEIDDRMELVSNTNEYPATFSIWSQLILSIVLPKAFQLAISSV